MNQDLSSSLRFEKDYVSFFNEIKDRLKITQLRVSHVVNAHVIQFYWQLGSDILHIESLKKHWGNKLLEQLSQDLQAMSPGLSGFSKRSLEYMRLLATLYPRLDEFAQQAAA